MTGHRGTSEQVAHGCDGCFSDGHASLQTEASRSEWSTPFARRATKQTARKTPVPSGWNAAPASPCSSASKARLRPSSPVSHPSALGRASAAPRGLVQGSRFPNAGIAYFLGAVRVTLIIARPSKANGTQSRFDRRDSGGFMRCTLVGSRYFGDGVRCAAQGWRARSRASSRRGRRPARDRGAEGGHSVHVLDNPKTVPATRFPKAPNSSSPRTRMPV